MAFRPGSNDCAGATCFVLQCRGDVRLYRGGVDCTPKSRKARALLAILAAEERPLTRTKIIDTLWSESPEEQARASLRTLLADLRGQFGSAFGELLIVDRERLALGNGVISDLGQPPARPHSGELFESLDHLDPELDEWLRLERGRWPGHIPGNSAKVDRPRQSSSHIRFGAGLAAAAAVSATVALLVFR